MDPSTVVVKFNAPAAAPGECWLPHGSSVRPSLGLNDESDMQRQTRVAGEDGPVAADLLSEGLASQGDSPC